MAVRTDRHAFVDQPLSRKTPRLASILRLLLSISIMLGLAGCGRVSLAPPYAT